jgi:hypothetical protein
MPFATDHANDVLLLGDTVIWGTCMLGDDLGTVVSCRLKRTGNLQDITDQHGILKAMLLLNPRFELDLETVFEFGVPVPGLMDELDFPFLQIKGRVIDAEILWQRGGERGLSIRASNWDALRNAELVQHWPSTAPFLGTPEGAILTTNDNTPINANDDTPFTVNTPP